MSSNKCDKDMWFYSSDFGISYIPYRAELLSIFPPASPEDEINWIAASDTFPRFMHLLAFRSFRHNVLPGLVVSLDAFPESVASYSSLSLISYLEAHHLELEELCLKIIVIFLRHQKVDRITVPLLGFLDRLFSSGCLRSVLENPHSEFASCLLRQTECEIGNTRNVIKLLRSVGVFCHLLQVSQPGPLLMLFSLILHFWNGKVHTCLYVHVITIFVF
ncbi:tubulin-specific chaperone D-like [Zootermopsis nevadensis]|uniref:tubulin-specific chaperone D-like n=1 Tax=Zootermopsis nevadensis TaxID=136037 RepID=UPI000B8E4EB6|nr:tubulin-specific chaperone D-like [Zootermopsis nevadensis]